MKTVTKIFAIVLVLGLVFGFSLAGNVKAADEDPVCNTNSGLCYTTIQAAITAATSGDTIFIGNGTYNESLNIYKSLTLNGESEAGVIIDAIGSTSYGIDASGDFTTYFSNFTLNNAGTYGLKIAGENAYTHINHVTVNHSGASGIDLNGVAGGTINDVNITDSVDGVGLALTDTSNVAVSNVTTSGNDWGGMAIYVAGEWSYTGGSSNISLTGTNSFAEAQDFYIQEENGYEVTSFTQTDFSFTVVNETDAPGFILFYKTQAEATAVALYMTNPVDSVITNLTSDTFLVVPGLSIQAAHDAAAPGDTIIVADGTYNYDTEGHPVDAGLIKIQKSITLKAQEDGNGIMPVIDASGAGGLTNDGVFKIHATQFSGGTVVIEGFDITGIPQTGIAITAPMYQDPLNPNTIIIRNNKIHGMIGAIDFWGTTTFVTDPDPANAVASHIVIDNNEIYDMGVADVEQGLGVMIEDPAVWAVAGNDYAAKITNNTFYNIVSKDADNPGAAIVLPRADSATEELNVLIQNNTINPTVVGVGVGITGGSGVDHLEISGNKILNTGIGVLSMITETVDASPNWWGTAVDDLIAARVMGDVTFEPYWVDAGMTILSSTLPATVYVDDSFTYSPESCGGHICGYDGFITIQEGIDGVTVGGTVNVAAGMYTQRLIIDKAVTVLGPTANVNKNGYTIPANYAWDTSVEAVINYPDPTGLDKDTVLVDIISDDVTFKGFIVQILNARVNSDHLLRLNAGVLSTPDTLDNVTIENNVLGPVTNTVTQDGTYGRMGLYFSSPSYPAQGQGITNTHVVGNTIFDTRGNGDTIFIWGAAASYSSLQNADYTGTVIEDNDIYGSHRAGIEIAGGVSGLTIQSNKIHDNSSTNGGVSSTDLKYGSGIVIIRMGSDKANPLGMGVDGLSILNNEIYDNEKHGIYTGPIIKNLHIDGNDIEDNGSSGLQIDLTEAYYGAVNPVLDYATGIDANGNSITGNGSLGVEVVGVPTNGFELDATANWWGTAIKASIEAMVSDYIAFTPYYIESTLTDLSEPLPTVVWVDDSFTYSPESCGTHICGYDGFVTIQEGIDGVAEGGTVNVAAGTYAEPYIYPWKPLDLLGPNTGTPGDETRVGEAVIVGPANWYSVYIDAENVTIDGFTFDGENLVPFTDGFSIGIYNVANGLTLQNNIFTNHNDISIFTSGGDYGSGLYITEIAIKDNLITLDAPVDSPYNFGLYLQSTVGTVKGNVIENVNSGIQVQPYKAPGSGLVEDNIFSAYRRPVWFNYTDSDAADWLFKNNVLTGISRPVGSADTSWDGIRVETYTKGNVVFTGNTISIGDADTTVINMFRKIGHKGGTIDLEATLDSNTWEKVVVVRDSLGDIKETTLVTPDLNTPDLNGDATFFSTIQSAIDDVYTVAGDTVDVGAGTYVEQVTITKDITLLGAGKTLTTIRAFPSMPVCFTTSKDHRPVVCVKDNATATIDGFTIDGLGLGNTNVNFEGVAFRNAGGTLQNSLIKDIRDTPFSGAQHGVAVYVYNDDATARTVHILDNEISGFQKNAMALNASATNPLTVDVQRNTITGAGLTSVTAQNGIQFWADSGSGLIQDNTISGIAYDGTEWVGTSILNYYSDHLDVIHNSITGAHMGIYFVDGSGLIENNTLAIIDGGGSANGIYAGGGDVEIRYNTLSFQVTPLPGSLGIGVGVWGTNNASANVHDNIVAGFDWGLLFTESADPLDTGSFTSISAVNNTLYGNTNALYIGGPIPVTPYIYHNKLSDGTNFGIYNDLTGILNAEANWWGSMFGPDTDLYYGYVDFIKWCGDEACTFLLPDDAGVIEIGPGILTQGIVINQPNLTIRALNGTTIQPTSGACFDVNASYTIIETATNLGAVCIPPDGENGVNVADGLVNVVIKGYEFDGSADGVDGIHFNGITDLMIIDNWFHDLTGDAIEFTAQPTLAPDGVISIQGNLFQENDGQGINASTFTIPAEYNSWGHVDGALAGDGASDGVVTDPYTHVDLYLTASGVAPVGGTVTITVYGNLENVSGTTFTFNYPDTLSLDPDSLINHSDFVPSSGTSVFTVAAGTITFDGYVGMPLPGEDPNQPISGEALPLFSATFEVLAAGGVLDLDDTNDKFTMINDVNEAPSNNIYALELFDGELVDLSYTVKGTVSMQGRSVKNGVPVALTGTGIYGPYEVTSINVLSNNYTFTGVADGEYVFTTNQPRYLNVAGGTLGITPLVDVDGNITLPSLVLKGGNAYWINETTGILHNRIDGGDASVVGFWYGNLTNCDGQINCGDVNFDGLVNITDLTLVGGNWGLTSANAYGSWLP